MVGSGGGWALWQIDSTSITSSGFPRVAFLYTSQGSARQVPFTVSFAGRMTEAIKACFWWISLQPHQHKWKSQQWHLDLCSTSLDASLHVQDPSCIMWERHGITQNENHSLYESHFNSSDSFFREIESWNTQKHTIVQSNFQVFIATIQYDLLSFCFLPSRKRYSHWII